MGELNLSYFKEIHIIRYNVTKVKFENLWKIISTKLFRLGLAFRNGGLLITFEFCIPLKCCTKKMFEMPHQCIIDLTFR